MLPTVWVLKWIPTDDRYFLHRTYYTHNNGELGIWKNEKRANMAAARGGRKKLFGYWQPIEVKLTEIEKE